jgi:hypothetical protein
MVNVSVHLQIGLCEHAATSVSGGRSMGASTALFERPYEEDLKSHEDDVRCPV